MDQHRCLSKGSVFSMPLRMQTQLRVVEGCAWITLVGCAQDHILKAGESLCMPPNQLLVAEALQDCVMIVEAILEAPSSWLQRLPYHLKGLVQTCLNGLKSSWWSSVQCAGWGS